MIPKKIKTLSDTIYDDGVLRDILTSLPVGIAWTEHGSGEIVFVNRKFSQMFGYTIDELSTVEDWIHQSYVDPSQAEATERFWKMNQRDGATPSEMDSVELDILCKDGRVKTVLSSKILLPKNIGALSTFLDITPRKQEERLIRQLAQEDPLTGVFNRRAFSERLVHSIEQCKQYKSAMALMVLDMDNFKEVNDTYGHAQGDHILQQIAQRLARTIRDQDTLSRHGGDEFCVILSGISGSRSAYYIAERMIDELSQPFTLDNGELVPLGVSIGIALYPENGDCEEGLLAHADKALYTAKAGGKGHYHH